MAIKSQRGAGMKTKFGCIVLPCGCLMPGMITGFGLLISGVVVLARALF